MSLYGPIKLPAAGSALCAGTACVTSFHPLAFVLFVLLFAGLLFSAYRLNRGERRLS